MTTKGLWTVPMVAMLALIGNAQAAENFRAHLAGRNEVPPVDTRAQGQVTLKVSDFEDKIQFRLNVANIRDVIQAHIHCGAQDVNGPVVVFLFGFVPTGVDVNGILAEGTIVGEDVIERPDSLACPGGVANLADLISKIRTGEAYVNVHTLQFPPGEIRGQLR